MPKQHTWDQMSMKQIELLVKEYEDIPSTPGGRKLYGYLEALARKWLMKREAILNVVKRYRRGDRK